MPVSADLNEAVGPLGETTSIPKLQHLAKNRPKPVKTRTSRRAIVSHAGIVEYRANKEAADESFENKLAHTSSPLPKDVANGAEGQTATDER